MPVAQQQQAPVREFRALVNFDVANYFEQAARKNIKGAAQALNILPATLQTWVDRSVMPLAVWRNAVAMWGDAKLTPTIETLPHPFRLPPHFAPYLRDPTPVPPVQLVVSKEPEAKAPEPVKPEPVAPTPQPVEMDKAIAYILDQLVNTRLELLIDRATITKQQQQILDLETALHRNQEDLKVATTLLDQPAPAAATAVPEAAMDVLTRIANQRGVLEDLKDLLPKGTGSPS